MHTILFQRVEAQETVLLRIALGLNVRFSPTPITSFIHSCISRLGVFKPREILESNRQ